jgi:beta-glucosidase
MAPDPVPSPDQLLARLDLRQKIRLISGADFWSTQAEPAIGLRRLVLSDGPSGVRGERWDERDPSISLPCGTALAATWDPELVARLGALIAAEARRKDVDVVLGPTINLHRSPLGGRHFEAFSEDPLLTGVIAAAYVAAVQAHGVGTCPKHFVANDSETDRFTVDVRVDERTLREVYLAPFEQVVAAGAWALMAAYNCVNGTTMTASPLLRGPLKSEWGFEGVVVSDWTAVRSTETAAAATDLAMPGPAPLWGDPLAAALQRGAVEEPAIDDKVRRLLRLAGRVGALAPGAAPAPPEPHDAVGLVREAAARGMVLLRNEDDLLPLDAGALRTIAVLGANAATARIQGGGSATVVPAGVVDPLSGLREALEGRVAVRHAVGAHLRQGLAPVGASVLAGQGLEVRFLDADGTELRSERRRSGFLLWLGAEVPNGAATLDVRGRLRLDRAGEWRIGFAGLGALRLDMDGERALEEVVLPEGGDLAAAFLRPPQRSVARGMAAGQEVEVALTRAIEPNPLGVALALGVEPPRRSDAEELAAAVALARESDVAVVVVGTTEEIESEGFDRTSLALPAGQDDLVRAVAAVNRRTVVVVNAGAPVEMPWRDEVAAILVAWFPGQEFGAALADVLLGAAEPGGRLPTTWPASMADAPVLSTRPEGGTLRYAEGLHVGYRAWARTAAAPVFPFGSGLGYASWSYEAVSTRPVTTAGEDVPVTVRVRNTGRRTGSEVVQAYLSRRDSAVERPALWLAGFARVSAGPGEQAIARVTLPARAFQHWSPAEGRWETEPGTFALRVGGSAAATPLDAAIEVRA